MDTTSYTRCVQLIVNEEDYAKLYNYLLKHKDEDPIIEKWLNKKCDIFIQGFTRLRKSTAKEKSYGYGDYVEKPIVK